ncbi:alpha/beta hydrolase [Flammeovirga sp. MY04]|uniref:alpha/beta hydrolase n=1 Tax=Flammeovirga sp. MY04 TaxID=1191459 RepID=UPI0008060C67|nr:alpha/beta hydrolase [Flammeovirga sp. MY04]ANQ51456.1 alpha/beta hydrolase [Flammeovirga sp. MY04]
MKYLYTVLFIIGFTVIGNCQNKPTPDKANLSYGNDTRNVMDIWLAKSNKPTPLAIYIHGGGFKGGSKEKLSTVELNQLLKSGISVASINYRLIDKAPLPAAFFDAKEALQFIRFHADELNIEKEKIAVWGGSAGAVISMWLAFSDEMSEPNSENHIHKESTRVLCVGTKGGQTDMTSDFWIPLLKKYSPESVKEFSGKKQQKMYGVKTKEGIDEIATSISAVKLISSDDPPIHMKYAMFPGKKAPKDPKKLRGWVIHHVDFGLALKEKMDKLNVENHLIYPGSKDKMTLVEFLVEKLSVQLN